VGGERPHRRPGLQEIASHAAAALVTRSLCRVAADERLVSALQGLANAPAAAPDDFVFASDAGTELAQNNIRVRTLERAVELANSRLIAAGDVPLPDGLTPHKLRHSFASLLVAIGTDPGAVMDQLGHADAGFTLRVYGHGMRRDAAAKRRLCALVGVDSPPTGADTLLGSLKTA
jgi:integrase